MKTVIELTEQQKLQLSPLFRGLESYDKPGAIVAQIGPDRAFVFLVGPEKASALSDTLKAINDQRATA